MPLNDLRTKTLMISLWNYDRLGRNIFLGEVLLPMVDKVDQGALTGHSSDWYDLEEMVGKHFHYVPFSTWLFVIGDNFCFFYVNAEFCAHY